MSDYQDDPQAERDAAEERLARIRGGGAAQPPEPEPEETHTVQSRAYQRGETREADYVDADDAEVVAAPGVMGRGPLALIGCLVLILLLIGGVLFALNSGALRSTSLPFFPTPTATLTPTPTPTPTPTVTPTPSPTPTPEVPFLALPPLDCAYGDIGVGCFDYCADPANAEECTDALDFVSAQDADAEYWLNCIAPGPGPNVGNPQVCLEEAWRLLNP